MFADLFRPKVIIGALPITLTNGTTADATQVMADLNWIVNQVNANAAALANVALTNANNNFTVVQSGIAATAAAHFPIASQVQNQVFNTLSSTLGTNIITARVSALPLTAYAQGQVFTFVPSQTNTGPANITVDAAGSSIIASGGFPVTGGELVAGVPVAVYRDSTKMNMLGRPDVSTARFWVVCNETGTISDSYNVTSITDLGTGSLAVTINRDFASSSWCASVSVFDGADTVICQVVAITAGSVTLQCTTLAPVVDDPQLWFVKGFGKQI